MNGPQQTAGFAKECTTVSLTLNIAHCLIPVLAIFVIVEREPLLIPPVNHSYVNAQY